MPEEHQLLTRRRLPSPRLSRLHCPPNSRLRMRPVHFQRLFLPTAPSQLLCRRTCQGSLHLSRPLCPHCHLHMWLVSQRPDLRINLRSRPRQHLQRHRLTRMGTRTTLFSVAVLLEPELQRRFHLPFPLRSPPEFQLGRPRTKRISPPRSPALYQLQIPPESPRCHPRTTIISQRLNLRPIPVVRPRYHPRRLLLTCLGRPSRNLRLLLPRLPLCRQL